MDYEHPKRDLLVAFVDGRLDREQADEAAALIEQDPWAAQFVSLLRRSALPYSDAFGSLLTLPAPRKVVSMIEGAEISFSDNRDAADGVSERTDKVEGLCKPVYPGLNKKNGSSMGVATRFARYKIAVGFAFGVVITLLITELGRINQPPEFVQSVSQYQSLYQRDTVSEAKADRVAVKQMMRQALGLEIPIPNFGEHGFEFKRGQLLQLNGKPLVQLVYLADHGNPVAFCITPILMEEVPDMASPKRGHSHGLDYGYWQQSGLGFVVAGDPSHGISTLTNRAMSAVNG